MATMTGGNGGGSGGDKVITEEWTAPSSAYSATYMLNRDKDTYAPYNSILDFDEDFLNTKFLCAYATSDSVADYKILDLKTKSIKNAVYNSGSGGKTNLYNRLKPISRNTFINTKYSNSLVFTASLSYSTAWIKLTIEYAKGNSDTLGVYTIELPYLATTVKLITTSEMPVVYDEDSDKLYLIYLEENTSGQSTSAPYGDCWIHAVVISGIYAKAYETGNYNIELHYYWAVPRTITGSSLFTPTYNRIGYYYIKKDGLIWMIFRYSDVNASNSKYKLLKFDMETGERTAEENFDNINNWIWFQNKLWYDIPRKKGEHYYKIGINTFIGVPRFVYSFNATNGQMNNMDADGGTKEITSYNAAVSSPLFTDSEKTYLPYETITGSANKILTVKHKITKIS